MPDHFGFESTPQPKINDTPDSMTEIVAHFAQIIEEGLNGIAKDDPDVPAIAVIYLHDDPEGTHPHVFALARTAESLALLGYMGIRALDDYIGDAINGTEE